MLPMKALRLALGSLLAADVPTLAPATANQVALVAAPFSLGEDLVIGSLTLASFVGSTPIAGVAGAQGVGIDPATGQQQVNLTSPAGGWRFTCTTAPGTPQTIYGAVLTDTTGATLLAAALLPTPLSVSVVGDVIDLGSLDISFVLQPMS